jgi:hypothetical protein
MIVEDAVMQRIFINTFTLQVTAAQIDKPSAPPKKAQPPGKQSGDNPDGQSGIALPNVIRLENDHAKWSEHFGDDHDCLDIIEDVDQTNGNTQTTYTFYMNEDNRALQTELKASKTNAQVLLKQFEVGSVLVGLALIHDQQTAKKPEAVEGSEEKDADATLQSRVRLFSRAIAPVLLPMIRSLGELGEDDLEQSDLVGQATEAIL